MLRLWTCLGIVALLELAGSAVAFLLSGGKKAESTPKALIDAGKVKDFEPETVTLIRKAGCCLVRLRGGGFLALSIRCTHLGCAVAWVEERRRFECPCHASAFDITGNVLKSPATRALDRFAVIIEHDKVRIDANRPIRRTGFSEDQLVFVREPSVS